MGVGVYVCSCLNPQNVLQMNWDYVTSHGSTQLRRYKLLYPIQKLAWSDCLWIFLLLLFLSWCLTKHCLPPDEISEAGFGLTYSIFHLSVSLSLQEKEMLWLELEGSHGQVTLESFNWGVYLLPIVSQQGGDHVRLMHVRRMDPDTRLLVFYFC